MTAPNRRPDIITLLRKLDRRLTNVERVTKYDDNTEPPLPPSVQLNFKIAEKKTHAEYRALVSWATVSANTCQADVDYWVVEFQATNANGVPIDQIKDTDGTPFTWTKNINNKSDVDTPHAAFAPVIHPLDWFYQARVRIVDKAHRKGPWSDWVGPLQPAEEADPQPPVPTGLHINFNTLDGTRWDRQQAEVLWDEINAWDIPGDRSVTVVNATEASQDATLTTSVAHFIHVDDKVEVKGVQPAAYNGSWKITAVPSGTTFKYHVGATVANLTGTGTVTDVVDHENDVAAYNVQFRRCTAGGAQIGGLRKRTVTAKDTPGATTASVAFEKGLKKTNYYQTRVRAIDRFHRKGDWTPWTTPATPGDATAPPVPVKVRAYASIAEIGMEWEAPADPDDPELPHQDVAYFQVQAAMGPAFNTIIRRDIFVNSTRKAWDTKRYKTKFWLRVRCVDSAGNKSAWVSRGPVKPVRAGSQKKRGRGEADIEWTNDDGKATYTGQPNRAYVTTNTNVATAFADAGVDDLGLPNNNGIVSGMIKLSATSLRARAGLVFRGSSNSDYMWVDLDKTTASGTVRLRKKDGGSETSLTTAAVTLVEGQEYDLQVIMEGNKISVYVNEVLIIDQYTMTGPDFTKYSAFSKYGMIIDRGASRDDGNSRVSDFLYTNADGIDVLLDFFDRTDNALTLGNTETGQPWVVGVGSWGVAKHRVAGSVIGLGVQRPDLTFTDNTSSSPSTDHNAYDLYTAATFKLDRPVKLTLWGLVVVSQATVVDFRCFLALVVQLGGQAQKNGVGSFIYLANNGNPNQIVNMRTVYLDPGGVDPKDLTISWGIKQNDSSNRVVTIYQKRMIAQFSYAPDVDPSADIKWTEDAAFKAYYRGEDPDDA